jgi:hypothetical protein
MSALSKRLWPEEGLEVACCDDEAGALGFCKLAATSPADGELDVAKICVDDEPCDCAVEDVNAWVENDDGDGDEARLLCLKGFRSSSLRLSFAGGTGASLISDDV